MIMGIIPYSGGDDALFKSYLRFIDKAAFDVYTRWERICIVVLFVDM
jgi:hypothetical protein